MSTTSSLWAAVASAPGLGLQEEPAKDYAPPIGRRRRRGYAGSEDDGLAKLDLVRDPEGLLRWVYSAPQFSISSGRRDYRSVRLHERPLVQRFSFNELGRNEMTDKLGQLDEWLTPGQGMKRWSNKSFKPDAQPKVDSGRVLLLVHGTFSNSEMWDKELRATEQGDELLKQWDSRYSTVLAFSHPTLSTGAWFNALDLNRALRNVTVPIDVICHSRGGLVVSWLLRLSSAPKIERVVFVGAPLIGTSLAAPDKLRGALDLLANYADAISGVSSAATGVFPFAAGVSGLAKILGKTLRLGSGLPLIDAAVTLVPGLATQQQVANNKDLEQLFADDWLGAPSMSAIGVSFQPDESKEPIWKFWKRFSHIGDQLKHGAADLVFPGPNDLVVDVNAMFRLGEKANIDFEDLGSSPSTHHTNYFRDARVLSYLDKTLK